MKKSIIYSITIYLLFSMLIILQKPKIICNLNGDFKSLNYLKYKLLYGYNNPDELICLPIVLILCSICAYIIAKNIT
jgi:hypothetical protein